MLLCDSWFASRREADGFLRRDEWRILFYPGQNDQIEEITDLTRWLRRVKRGRALHDLDFGMSLEAIDEIKMYGRSLAPYERFAAGMLERLRRMLRQAA
jgi:pyruvate-formate lyase-activating enzyme